MFISLKSDEYTRTQEFTEPRRHAEEKLTRDEKKKIERKNLWKKRSFM